VSVAPRLSITIPAYNECVTLEAVVEEAVAVGDGLGTTYEVLVVDDGSVDGTAEIADRLARRHERVRVVHHKRNRGFSGAMRSCLQEAHGEYMFLGPADGQASYDDIKRFWELVDDYDLIFSYRIERGDSRRRKLSSAAWYLFLRVLFAHEIPEFSSTFLFRRDAVPELPIAIRPDASNFLPLTYLTAIQQGRRVGVLGTVQEQRRGGVAKGGNLAIIARTVFEDVRLWWRLSVRPRGDRRGSGRC
jgi:glycosyltransferase involved in cell wall biosynthesis